MSAEVQITLRTVSGSTAQLSGHVEDTVASTITETLAKILLDNATNELAGQASSPTPSQSSV